MIDGSTENHDAGGSESNFREKFAPAVRLVIYHMNDVGLSFISKVGLHL